MMPLPAYLNTWALYGGTALIAAVFIGITMRTVLPSTLAAAAGSISSSRTDSGSNVVFLTPEGVQTGVPRRLQPSKLTVANNGSVYMGGARVVSIQNGTLEVQVSWQSANLRWDIDTADAKYLDASGEPMKPDALNVGDLVSITGALSGSLSAPTVEASYIRIES